MRQNRSYIGIELNPEYVEVSRKQFESKFEDEASGSEVRSPISSKPLETPYSVRRGSIEMLTFVSPETSLLKREFATDLAEYQKTMEEVLKPFHEIAAPLQRVLDDQQARWEQIQKQLSDSFAPMQRVFEEQQAQWSKQQDEWAKYSQQIAEGIKRFETALEKSGALGRYGWMLPMNATPREIVEIIDATNDEATADAAFIDYFTAYDGHPINDLIAKTLANPALQNWKPLLDEALSCLQEKKYRVCTSALLPVLDGFCAVRFAIPQFQSKRHRQRFLDQRRQAVANSTTILRFEWLAFIGFVESIFHDYDFSNPTPPPLRLNRHLILHGRDIPQARLEDCLRLLLALDGISELAP